MTLQQLEELMLTGNMTYAIEVLEQHILINNLAETFKQYLPIHHDVNDCKLRPDKLIKDDNGNITSKIPLAHLSLPVQKKITMIAAAFLGTPELESTPKPGKETDLMQMVQEMWDANKLDYKFKTLAKFVMSERHCAELWYLQDVDQSYWDGYPINANFKLSMKLLANSLGDKLYPVFDEYGVMIGFGRSYHVMTVVPDKSAPELILHFDVYTADVIYESKMLDNAWLFSQVTTTANPTTGNPETTKAYTPGVSSIPNPIGKIPVIYYWQPYTEWHDVQALIDRLEKKISNHADTNDYFDSPIIIAKGKITGFAQKGETGKLLEAENGADIKYLTWDQAPASTAMEIDNLQKFIHSYTHTPDISFENMKGLGIFSGVAIKMLFLDAHLKAADKEEIFGEGLQRRINFLKKSISVMDTSFASALPLNIKIKFNYFLPQNMAELTDVLTKMVGSGILSKETAIEQNPLVEDPVQEAIRIKVEGPTVPEPGPIPIR